jgi:gas vesicle protein GvpG
MGLLTGLLTLPLAPVRGTVWIAERLVEQAERELGDEATLRRRLTELQVRHELGEISDEELAEGEDVILARLAELRRPRGAGDGS